jgi:hypothetical protein
MLRIKLGCLVFVFTATVTGCQRRPALHLVPVSGKVTYQGRGVSKATVLLLADTGRADPVPSSTAQTEEDGSFTLQTPPHGSGVVPGSYRVTVQHYGGAIPVDYGNPAKTSLQVKVPEEGLTSWEIRLE